MNLFGEDFIIDVQENTVKDLVKKLSGKNGEEISSEKLLKSKKLTLEERLNIITDKVLNDIKDLTPLGPLHHPGEIAGIEAAQEVFKGVPNVAVSMIIT